MVGISLSRHRPSRRAVVNQPCLIERLERRRLLASTFMGSWPGPHDLTLTLDNSSPASSETVTVTGANATISLAQYNADLGAASFSGTIVGPPLQPFHSGDANLLFLVDGSNAA